MTKTKSQKLRAKSAAAKPQRKGKKWEFSLVKTGDNHVSVNSGNSAGNVGSRSMGQGSQKPKVRSRSQQPGIMDHPMVQDEFIQTINGNTGFENTPIAIQPGISATFAWGSKVSRLYERYVVEDITFYYKPRVTAFASVGQTGKVILSCDYDAASAPPASLQDAEATDPHADGMPYESISLRLDPRRCTPAEGKFVRQGMVAGTDIKTYDAGVLNVSVAGTPSSSGLIGELRVRYAIRLLNPKLNDTVSVKPCFCVSRFVSPAGSAFVTGNALGGFAPTTNPLAIELPGPGDGDFLPPAGNYLISFQAYIQGRIGASPATLSYVTVRFYKGGVVVYGEEYEWSTTANYTIPASLNTFASFSGSESCTWIIDYVGAAGLTGAITARPACVTFHMV